jgi:hypothetical protein
LLKGPIVVNAYMTQTRMTFGAHNQSTSQEGLLHSHMTAGKAVNEEHFFNIQTTTGRTDINVIEVR